MSAIIQQQKALARKNALQAAEFIWYDQHGRAHRIGSMSTDHLFNTLRMVWNNTMPEEVRVGDFVRYTFSGGYTTEYLMKMCRLTLDELGQRSVPPWMGLQLAQMRRYVIGSGHAPRIGTSGAWPERSPTK